VPRFLAVTINLSAAVGRLCNRPRDYAIGCSTTYRDVHGVIATLKEYA